jgi:predicted RNase H-like nuclease
MPQTSGVHVIGLDACRGGWAAVWLSDGPSTGVHVGGSLPECLARRVLGARRGSVFAIPARPVWGQPDYADAVRACRALTGKGFSIQAREPRARLLEANSKHTLPGRERRRALLAAAGISVVLPDPPQYDREGREIAIRY